MSSSPKYTVVNLQAARASSAWARQAQLAAARAARQRQREAEIQRRREERLRRQEQIRQHRDERLRRQEQREAEIRRQRDERAERAVQAERSAAQRLADAQAARQNTHPGEAPGRLAVLARLRERLAAPGSDAARLAPARYARCTDLLAELESAAHADGVRFEVLLGTAEHEIAGYADAGTTAADAARAALDEAADLLGAVRAAAESALAESRAFRDSDLAARLAAALDRATAALDAAQADPGSAAAALSAARALAQTLAGVETRLDELTAAHERRAEFAAELKETLANHGMSFRVASDTGDRFILQFESLTGAVYTAAVDDGEDIGLQVSYAIDGEADIPVLPEPGQVVCDQTEDFLDQVHAALAPVGYQAGELLWDGKPPARRASRARRAQAERPRQRKARESP
ncbi:MAG: hypothetical protein ABSF03_11370 [Streptosporangiaceae bacterium]|jgi:DNA repair exonuclease SbcCD ATPase subunit